MPMPDVNQARPRRDRPNPIPDGAAMPVGIEARPGLPGEDGRRFRAALGIARSTSGLWSSP